MTLPEPVYNGRAMPSTSTENQDDSISSWSSSWSCLAWAVGSAGLDDCGVGDDVDVLGDHVVCAVSDCDWRDDNPECESLMPSVWRR